MSDEQIYQALDSLKNLFHYEIITVNPSDIKPKFQSNSPSSEYMNGIKYLNDGKYIWSRLEITDKKLHFTYFSEYSLLEYLFDTARFDIKIRPQASTDTHSPMNDEQIYRALDSLKTLFYYNPPISSMSLKPNFKSDNPEIEYMHGVDLLKNGKYIWSRLSITNKEREYDYISESSLVEYLFDTAHYEIKIKPYEKVDYKNPHHQSNVGFSADDGEFYVKRASNGKIYLMVEHSDSKYQEARLASHGNCSYDLQYSSMMVKFKDGTVKTLTNVYPVHEIDCNGGSCHHFTDQFDITTIKVADIVKIRLNNLYDKHDYNNKYIGEMLSLMQTAAIENYKESKAQDDF